MVSQINGTWYCKSTDTKPTGVAINGQPLVEMDTGKIYFRDAEGESGSEWIEWVPASGS